MCQISGVEKLQRLVSLKMLSQRRTSFWRKNIRKHPYTHLHFHSWCTRWTSKDMKTLVSLILQLKHLRGNKQILFILNNFLGERKSWICMLRKMHHVLCWRDSVQERDGSGGVPQGDERTQPHLPVTTPEYSIRAGAVGLWANALPLQPLNPDLVGCEKLHLTEQKPSFLARALPSRLSSGAWPRRSTDAWEGRA